MSLRQSVCAGLMGIALAWCAPRALAQAQPAGAGISGASAASQGSSGGAVATPAPLPQVSVPPEAYGDPTSNREALRKFIDAHVARLVNDADSLNQSLSRDELSRAVYEKGKEAQPQFLYEYGRLLNDALVQLLNANSSMRSRLNMAIVAQRVASVARNATLQDAVLKLINDKDEAVVLWGLKAAGPIIPEAVKIRAANANSATPIVAAVAPAVLKHPSGEIFEEAYGALSSASEPVVADELLKVWENRLEQYKVAIPDNASADARPVIVLTESRTWQQVLNKPELRTRVMQMIVDQMFLAAWHADKGADKEKRDQLLSLVQRTAEGVWVVGKNQNLPALVQAAEPASKLKPENMPTGQKIMTNYVEPIIGAILKEFPQVKAPQPPAGGGGGVAEQK